MRRRHRRCSDVVCPIGLRIHDDGFDVVDQPGGVDGSHDGLVSGNLLAGYAHVHSLATPGWAEAFTGLLGRIARTR